MISCGGPCRTRSHSRVAPCSAGPKLCHRRLQVAPAPVRFRQIDRPRPHAPAFQLCCSRRRSAAASDHQPCRPPQHRAAGAGAGRRRARLRQSGKRYIEGLAGLWCTGLGYGNEELVEAAREQMSRLSFTHLFGGRSHEPAIALAEKIKALAPVPGLQGVLHQLGLGSQRYADQARLVLQQRARPAEEARRSSPAHAPITAPRLPPRSLSGLPCSMPTSTCRWRACCTPTARTTGKYAEPGESEEEYARGSARNLEDLIEREGPETIAAFIAEPVMGAGGVIDSAHAPTSRRCRPCCRGTTSPSSPTR